MKPQNVFIDFVIREWLLIFSAVGLLITSFYSGHLPEYSSREKETIVILFSLFVVVNALQQQGVILKLARLFSKGKRIFFKLTVFTFVLSMFITNDVALIVIVPLTLSLDIEKKDVAVILEALAANAGSALTPFGNPQNLYIYWYYELSPREFMASIFPFVFLFNFCGAFVVCKIRKYRNKKER